MSNIKFNNSLPIEEVSFLEDIEGFSGEILKEKEILFEKKPFIDVEGHQVIETYYKRGYVIEDSHIIGLSMRTNFSLGGHKAEFLGEPLPELPLSINNLKELKYLDLAGNIISKEILSFIFNLTKLDSLFLSGNTLPSLDPSIGSLTNLRKLFLSGNQIQHLPESIGNLVNLIELNLRGNLLISLPESIGNLKLLERLELMYNRLQSLPLSLCNLKRMKYLNLEGNHITNLPESFGELSNLEYLNVADNLVERLPHSFDQLSKLKSLKLGTIKKLPSNITSFKDLEILRFDSREMLSIPEDIGNLKSLKVLDMGLNSVKTIPSSIGELISLEDLLIVNSQIEYLPESIGNLHNLKYLSLWENDLKEIPPTIDKLKNLEILNLHSNSLTKIPEEVGNLKNLKKLNLSDNKLTHLPSSLKNLINLTELDIHDNKFSQLPLWLWRLKKLEYFYLINDKNPWQAEWREVITRDLNEIKEFCREKDTLKVFISHAVIDFDTHKIKELSDFLEAQEIIYQAYYCEEDLRGNIDEFMNLVIPQCQVLIFIGTKQSIYNSIDCMHELELARKYGLTIIPVKGRDIEWSDFETVALNIDGFEFLEEDFNAYCKEIQNKLNQIHDEIEQKGNLNITLNQNMEEIQSILSDYIESHQFEELYRNAQNEFESFKLVLEDPKTDAIDVFYKLASIISQKGGVN